MTLHPKHFHRRLVLRGLGGAAVAAPFLGSLAERAAKAAGEPAPAPPKRLIIFFTHYGCLTDRFFPESANGPLTAASFAGLSTEPLGPYASKLLMPRGIRAMNQWAVTNGSGATYGQANDPHTQVMGSYFTCAPVTPNSDNPFDLQAGDARLNPQATAPSLDHVCARQVSPGGAPLYIRVGGFNGGPGSNISWSDAETAYQGVGTPFQVLTQISGLFASPTTSPDDYAVLGGKGVLDLIKHDLEVLQRMDMSQSDKEKLAAWKQLLQESTQQVVGGGTCSESLLEQLGLPSSEVLRGAPTIMDPSAPFDDNLDVGDLYSKLAALAAVCNANPVILLKYPPSWKFKGIEGATEDSHNISHRVGGATLGGTCVPNANAKIEKIDNFYAKKFAYLLSQLDGIAEGDGTLLDNTATVWFQEMSDGLAHNLNNMPIIQAGSCGGYFKTGQSINVDSVDPTRGNSSIHCQTEGAEIALSDISNGGTDPACGNAPINKYFCNLMNAIGVKAGPDGFPAVGGTERVTHYGMYDNTADFFGGGTNPAQINDPGEFEQLLA